jgi:hypothetical protein
MYSNGCRYPLATDGRDGRDSREITARPSVHAIRRQQLQVLFALRTFDPSEVTAS